MTRQPVHVQIVHGSGDVDFITQFLIPSLKASASRPVHVWTLAYDGSVGADFRNPDVDVTVVERPGSEPTGFGAGHNLIFRQRATDDDFIILNPDCVLLPQSIDRLIARKAGDDCVGIVEGRQWPFEHPKEYDEETGRTPWASGAFALISGDVFARIQGFDEAFFLYLEDVDLSWRVWLEGHEILYEPTSVAMHFSGGPFYRPDIRSAEEYFGARHFLLLLWKHFGRSELERGMAMIRAEFPPVLSEQIIADFERDYRHRVPGSAVSSRHRQVKVLGFNRFHEMRPT